MDMTPDEWRDKLISALNNRRREIDKRRKYYDGEHLLPLAPDDASDEYKRLAVLGQANMCASVVDSVVEGLVVDGINMRPGKADAEAGDIGLDVWLDYLQPNHIDAQLPMVFEEALKVGSCPVLVWPIGSGADRRVSITAEDPAECIVWYDAGQRRDRIAGLKVFRDDDRVEYCTLWLRDTGELYYWRSKGRAAQTTTPSRQPVATQFWEPWNGPDGLDVDQGGGPVRTNPMGKVVPLVEYRSRPKLDGTPQPELSHSVIIQQDRLNYRLFNSIVVGEHQSYPQRVAIGIQVDTDADGNPINPLKSGPERVWTLQAADGESTPTVTQLSAADLTQHIRVVEHEVKLMASISKTPLYSLAGDLVNVGADTVTALNEARIYKIKRHQLEFGESTEEVVQLALLAADRDDLAEQALTAEVTWANPELLSLAQRADAAQKLSSIGYPFEAIAQIMGETKTRIAELQSMSASARLLGAIGEAQASRSTAALDPDEMKKRVDSMGALIRAGVKPESAADQVGLSGVEFVPGAMPVTIRTDGDAG